MTFKNLGCKGVQTLSIGILALLLTACETTSSQKREVSIDATSVSNADFSSYNTYYVLEVPPGENKVAPPKPFSRVVVEAAVRKELDNRNYRETKDKDSADMLVGIQFSLKDEKHFKQKTVYDSQLVDYGGYGGYGTGYGRGFGNRSYGNRGYSNRGFGNRYSGYSYGYGYSNYYGYATIPRSTVVTEDFRQGNMVIDLIDPKTNSVVWEGHAAGEGEHEPEKIKAKVNNVVGRIFKKYPHSAVAPLDVTP